MSRTVRDLIERQAVQRPDAIFAIDADGQRSITYTELAHACRRIAAQLLTLGSQPGDTVALVMPNGLQTLSLLLGAMHGGWCVNPINLLSQPDQMRYVLDHSDCKVVIVSKEWEQPVRGMLAGIGRQVAVLISEPDADDLPDAQATTPAPAPDALALLMYTSGTTGRPKGVMHTHASLAANAQAISAEHALCPDDRVLAVLPLYHINAFAVTMLAPLAHGGSLALPAKFSAARFWAQASARQCTWLNVVPTMISYLLEGAVPPREQSARFRFCRSASAALPPEHLSAFQQKFGIGVIETMGMTETVAPAFSNPLDAAQRKLGAVGRPSGCEAQVVDANLVPLPDGQTGEITVRGPNVMRGYYKNEEATRASFTPDGWLRTGDLGHRDSDGFFFVTGRIKELIIKGGENIAPREIDEALLRHPCVLDAATVGVEDRHYGQDIEAYLVLRPGACIEALELRQHCLEHLGRFKSPRSCHIVDELPRGPSGKVQRLKLPDIPPARILATLTLH